jgi:hypothetical protein
VTRTVGTKERCDACRDGLDGGSERCPKCHKSLRKGIEEGRLSNNQMLGLIERTQSRDLLAAIIARNNDGGPRIVLYDENEPPALGEAMPKIIATKNDGWYVERSEPEKSRRQRREKSRQRRREKSWHQEMDEHFSAGGDLDTPPGGPYPFKAEPDPSSDPEERTPRVQDVKFVGGSYREAPRVIQPEKIDPPTLPEKNDAPWFLWVVLGGTALLVGSAIVFILWRWLTVGQL